MFDVVCAGIVTWDTLFSGIDSDLMKIDGQTASGYFAGSGGDAVNAGITLARLGMKTAVCGCVGNDHAADLVSQDLLRAGAESFLYRKEEIHTATPVILVDHAGERHLVRVPDNGNAFFERDMIPADLLDNTRHLHIASVNMLPKLDGKPLADLFAEAHERGITTSMDASGDREGKWMEKIIDVLPNCDIFIPSMQEAKMYAGSSSIHGIRDFFAKWNLRYFGVKLGADGVYLTDFREELFLPSLLQGAPLDTTGAGDAFMAGYVAAYLKGYDMRSCGLIGSAQSVSVMQKVGANTGAGTWDDAMKLLAEQGETLNKR